MSRADPLIDCAFLLEGIASEGPAVSHAHSLQSQGSTQEARCAWTAADPTAVWPSHTVLSLQQGSLA